MGSRHGGHPLGSENLTSQIRVGPAPTDPVQLGEIPSFELDLEEPWERLKAMIRQRAED